jgi:hypothetical protein
MVPPSRPGVQNGHRSTPADTASNAPWRTAVAGSVKGVEGLISDPQSTHRSTEHARQTCSGSFSRGREATNEGVHVAKLACAVVSAAQSTPNVTVSTGLALLRRARVRHGEI